MKQSVWAVVCSKGTVPNCTTGGMGRTYLVSSEKEDESIPWDNECEFFFMSVVL